MAVALTHSYETLAPAAYSPHQLEIAPEVQQFGRLVSRREDIADINGIPVTESNQHLFIPDPATGGLKVNYFSSALLGDMLESVQERQTSELEGVRDAPKHELAFIDVYGNFYDHAILAHLKTWRASGRSTSSGVPQHKHTAYFSLPSESGKRTIKVMPIGFIYFLSGAYRPELDLTEPPQTFI